MDRRDVDWRGYWPAAPTPFDRDGRLDEGSWRSLLGMYLEQGAHGVLANGSTGEWFSQSREERKRVAEIAAEELSGKIPVVIGCTDYTVDGVCALADHAASVGADGILCTPPPYFVPSPEEVLAFYQGVSDGSTLPLMVYNWPRGTNVDIGTDLASELANIERVVALKDSTDRKMRALQTLEVVVDRVRVFGSFINRVGLASLREIGGDGNIDGGGLGIRDGVGFYESIWKDDVEGARRHASAYVALSSQLIGPDWGGTFASPIAQLKAAMRLLDQPGGYARSPVLDLTDEGKLRDLKQVLASASLL